MDNEDCKIFSREAIQLVVTKKPLISFKVEASTDQKMGKSCTYKLHMQPEEENSPVYSLSVEVFELSSPKQWLVFSQTMVSVQESSESSTQVLEH
eukprot:2216627-Ditylum_brightwellii.AAC.1